MILTGDCREVLATLPEASVHCVVTSPPYFGLRSYLPADHPDKGKEIGAEKLHDCGGWVTGEPCGACFVCTMVGVFRHVRRVLRDDGTLWLNLGDSYNAAGRQGHGTRFETKQGTNRASAAGHDQRRPNVSGLKEKDLIGIPWRVALALQADGWYLRQDIIWAKPNPMPESVTDRCTKSHEYLFLLSKSARYHFDAEAIQEPCSPNTYARLSQDVQSQTGSTRVPGKTNGNMKAVGRKFDPAKGNKNNASFDAAMAIMPENRNKRTVWTVTTAPYKDAHFATFPPALVEPCILAGCPLGGTVLDPFFGSGTVGAVAQKFAREFIGIDLNDGYKPMQERRIAAQPPGLALGNAG